MTDTSQSKAYDPIESLARSLFGICAFCMDTSVHHMDSVSAILSFTRRNLRPNSHDHRPRLWSNNRPRLWDSYLDISTATLRIAESIKNHQQHSWETMVGDHPDPCPA